MKVQSEVRAERLSYLEIQERIDRKSLVYLPLGAIEFHGPHLPVGLDGLTAHGICVAAAQKQGGIVLPTFFYGTGGEHSDYPWTIMLESPDPVESVLATSMKRLQDLGVEKSVIISGHFALEQRAFLKAFALEWSAVPGNSMKVIALSVAEFEDSPVEPDHAAAFESMLLHSIDPNLVHTERLPDLVKYPCVDPDGNPFGAHRHNPGHPLWGAFGPDPRTADLANGETVRNAYVSWLLDMTQ